MDNLPIQVAAEDAIRALQAALPPGLTKPLAPVELENVKPTLLLPPTEKGGVASELAGGAIDLGDRVACLKSTGQQASILVYDLLHSEFCWLRHSPSHWRHSSSSTTHRYRASSCPHRTPHEHIQHIFTCVHI
jgi:hypothetical protein